MLQTKTGSYVLEDGGGSLIMRAWLCEHAVKTIDVQYFIFSTDNVGLIACDYIIRLGQRCTGKNYFRRYYGRSRYS